MAPTLKTVLGAFKEGVVSRFKQREEASEGVTEHSLAVATRKPVARPGEKPVPASAFSYSK